MPRTHVSLQRLIPLDSGALDQRLAQLLGLEATRARLSPSHGVGASKVSPRLHNGLGAHAAVAI